VPVLADIDWAGTVPQGRPLGGAETLWAVPEPGASRALLQTSGNRAACQTPDVTERPAVDTSLRERLAAAIASGPPPLSLAVLFGSAAEGRLRDDSDLDVAIVATDDGLDEAAEAVLRRRLTAAARRDVDLARVDEASTLLKWRIATTGTPVFEARPGTFRAVPGPRRFRVRGTTRLRWRTSASGSGVAWPARHHHDQHRARAGFVALEARTGQLLWSRPLGGDVRAGPMSYAVNGRRYVAVAAGHSLCAFALRPHVGWQ
jgi:predicted nucleotidyltransferase